MSTEAHFDFGVAMKAYINTHGHWVDTFDLDLYEGAFHSYSIPT